ncbi:hypothetical protein J3R30DRAFT_1094298 [Lentinula aciculospora]|uniref:Glycosyltransferase family 25 protein n=1 Tax=Lentinula aciculospora TaxID=153920 RepID=A0A9W9DJ18_9AGAR|nr:hypothetical protein J3R30DRAFT_1094298 [Lentinula aciculospora]
MTAPFRRLLFFSTILVLTTLGGYLYTSPEHLSTLSAFYSSSTTYTPPTHSLDLGFISKTYVISLPHRTDRREDIVRLMDGLRMSNWVYHDGTYANMSIVEDLLRHVQAQRVEEDYSLHNTIHLPFTWPADIEVPLYDSTFLSNQTSPAGAELWPSQPPPPDVALPNTSMVCAEENFRLTKYFNNMPQWRILTPQRVAAFHSHFTAIRRVVDDNARAGIDLSRIEGKRQENIALILEDDVDMEVDIKERMGVLLPMLPYDWDMLFLGFCWSVETNHPVVRDPYIIPKKNLLYPSGQPRCLHAYALSPAGAVRLLKHLRHEPFAYSRSVDLATAWLISDKRIKSFTVVPPVIIQRKVTKTDITLFGGSIWKEKLEEGVLGTKQSGDEV